jgi:hypothetical protein
MMPEKFSYPEKGWSVGKMRKMGEAIGGEANIGEAAGAFADHPVVGAMERMLRGQKQAQGQFDTKLSEAEETAFKKWKEKWAPKDSGVDYDLRGAFKAGFKPDENGHWPDLFKKPNHPTFSDQSVYAKEAPGMAGRWEGETFVPPGGG